MTKTLIGVVGAGFSGTAFAAAFHRMFPFAQAHLVIIDRPMAFGVGAAYSTPYDYHLLNVRAKDMSVFEDDADHFVRWLGVENDPSIGDQFISRRRYGEYLKHVLLEAATRSLFGIELMSGDVVDAMPEGNKIRLMFQNYDSIAVDKVVLATGNNLPTPFPFPRDDSVQCLDNPWKYRTVETVPSDAPVLIVGTGLSMIDAVLTLHTRKHQGKIVAVSRHGLLPLPHAQIKMPLQLAASELPSPLTDMIRTLRHKIKNHEEKEGSWHDVISALRFETTDIWKNLTDKDRGKFLRHAMPYWNIHRHRVHDEIAAKLQSMQETGQLEVIAGRVERVASQVASIRLRSQSTVIERPVASLINCMGPSLAMQPERQPLVNALLKRDFACLDPHKLGFMTNHLGALKNKAGDDSSQFFTIGPPSKGMTWECTAVPNIRQQVQKLVSHFGWRRL